MSPRPRPAPTNRISIYGQVGSELGILFPQLLRCWALEKSLTTLRILQCLSAPVALALFSSVAPKAVLAVVRAVGDPSHWAQGWFFSDVISRDHNQHPDCGMVSKEGWQQKPSGWQVELSRGVKECELTELRVSIAYVVHGIHISSVIMLRGSCGLPGVCKAIRAGAEA